MFAKVFVYGTLMRGERAERLMPQERFVGEAVTTKASFEMRNYHGLFPAVFPDGKERIKGEVYEVSPDELRELEDYEGDLYKRQTVETTRGPCDVFIANTSRLYEDSTPIEGGDWKSR